MIASIVRVLALALMLALLAASRVLAFGGSGPASGVAGVGASGSPYLGSLSLPPRG